jgi:hypothetical protein
MQDPGAPEASPAGNLEQFVFPTFSPAVVFDTRLTPGSVPRWSPSEEASLKDAPRLLDRRADAIALRRLAFDGVGTRGANRRRAKIIRSVAAPERRPCGGDLCACLRTVR